MVIAHSRVTSQGQISIPVVVRKDLDIHPGTELVWEKNSNGEYLVRPKRFKLKDIHNILSDIPIIHHTDDEIRKARKRFLERRFNPDHEGLAQK